MPVSAWRSNYYFYTARAFFAFKRTVFVLLVPTERSPFFIYKRSTFLRFTDSRSGFFDDLMGLLRHARIRFRSAKQVLLAREQLMKHAWSCTRNGFGARKLPAECSPEPKVLYLSSGMLKGAQTTVFVVPEEALALELLFL